jgi:hypothetical protein
VREYPHVFFVHNNLGSCREGRGTLEIAVAGCVVTGSLMQPLNVSDAEMWPRRRVESGVTDTEDLLYQRPRERNYDRRITRHQDTKSKFRYIWQIITMHTVGTAIAGSKSTPNHPFALPFDHDRASSPPRLGAHKGGEKWFFVLSNKERWRGVRFTGDGRQLLIWVQTIIDLSQGRTTSH